MKTNMIATYIVIGLIIIGVVLIAVLPGADDATTVEPTNVSPEPEVAVVENEQQAAQSGEDVVAALNDVTSGLDDLAMIVE